MTGIWTIRGVFQAFPLVVAVASGSFPWVVVALFLIVTVEVVWIDALFGSRYVVVGRGLGRGLEVMVYALKEFPVIGWPFRVVLSARERSVAIEEGKAARKTAHRLVTDFTTIVFEEFGLKKYRAEYDTEEVITAVIDQTELVKETSYPIIA